MFDDVAAVAVAVGDVVAVADIVFGTVMLLLLVVVVYVW